MQGLTSEPTVGPWTPSLSLSKEEKGHRDATAERYRFSLVTSFKMTVKDFSHET